jgi:hypothetical protein
VGALGLAPAEERDDVGAAAPAATSGQHEVFLGLEQDLGRALHRSVDAQLLGVLAVQLSEEVNDPSPDVGRNQGDLSQSAFFDSTQQLIGLA